MFKRDHQNKVLPAPVPFQWVSNWDIFIYKVSTFSSTVLLFLHIFAISCMN